MLTLVVLVGCLVLLFDLAARRAGDIGWRGHVNWLIALPALALVAILAADWVTIAAYVAPMLLWLLLAIGALVIGALVVLPTKSREGQAADKGAVGPLAEFFSREGAILILFFLLLHTLGDTLANLTFRLLFEDLGYTNDEIAFYDVGLGFRSAKRRVR